MRYLPILEELFESDSIIFLLIGLIFTLLIGSMIKKPKKNLIGFLSCLGVYAICEIISNIHTNNFILIVLLFIGTMAIGGVIGFLIALIMYKNIK